jgi:hypothetical protein
MRDKNNKNPAEVLSRAPNSPQKAKVHISALAPLGKTW